MKTAEQASSPPPVMIFSSEKMEKARQKNKKIYPSPGIYLTTAKNERFQVLHYFRKRLNFKAYRHAALRYNHYLL